LNDRFSAAANSETDWQALIQNNHTLDLLQSALAELNPEQYQCVTLFYLQKKSYHEISAETGFNMLQVKSYIQNGKRNLKILIEKKLQDEMK
jgi:DNA-directed RNA polymerase specialized sigma24 family protein